MSFHSPTEIIMLFDQLTAQHPTQIRKEIAGYSVETRPIPMYKIGNPQGGKLLLDGHIHAGSKISHEILYLYAKWLLKSREPTAQRILQRNYTLILPLINVDRSSGRKNANGVDLNRNFTYNWSQAGSTDPNSDYYRGPSPASEPETKMLKAIFEREKPVLYVNHHNWGGPWIGGFAANTEQRLFNDAVATKYAEVADEMGVDLYPYYKRGLSAGFAASDAALTGINSWLFELVQSGIGWPQYSEMESYYFPKWLPLSVALSQSCEKLPIFPVLPVIIGGVALFSSALLIYCWKR